jgi:hypothetical protein
MGIDLVPRPNKMERYSIHYSGGVGDYIANVMLFASATGSVLEALEHNYGYVRKADALRLADRLKRLYARLKKEDVRPVIERKVSLPRNELKALLLTVAGDIGNPDPPEWLLEDMLRMMSDEYWDWKYDFPHLIRLCKKGGGFCGADGKRRYTDES